MKSKFQIIHALEDEIEVIDVPEKFAPRGYVYVLKADDNFLEIAGLAHAAEKDRSEWIRRYENVLNGLKYWRSRALETK